MENSLSISSMKKIPTHKELKEHDFSQLLDPQYQKKILSRPIYNGLKRVFDLLLTIPATIILLPVMLAIIVAIRVDSKGKAMFAHKRVGKDGKLFTIYKFRTMHQDTDTHAHSPSSRSDERITKVGKFLRRTSLDELPQLFNIIIGNMSLVGPRPEMEFIVKTYMPLEKARLLVKPGLTGIWQIAGRKDLPLHKNLEFDLYYIENRSILFDLLIIFKTIGVVLRGKGAY